MKQFSLTLTLFLFVQITQLVNAQTVKIGSTNYSSINDAITAATDGDIIDISGVHTESISINKSITLRGSDPSFDIIEAATSKGTASSGVITISAEGAEWYINIENLGIRYGNSTENGGGISVDKVIGIVTLKNLIVENNASSKNGGGLSITGSVSDIIDCTIKNNT